MSTYYISEGQVLQLTGVPYNNTDALDVNADGVVGAGHLKIGLIITGDMKDSGVGVSGHWIFDGEVTIPVTGHMTLQFGTHKISDWTRSSDPNFIWVKYPILDTISQATTWVWLKSINQVNTGGDHKLGDVWMRGNNYVKCAYVYDGVSETLRLDVYPGIAPPTCTTNAVASACPTEPGMLNVTTCGTPSSIPCPTTPGIISVLPPLTPISFPQSPWTNPTYGWITVGGGAAVAILGFLLRSRGTIFSVIAVLGVVLAVGGGAWEVLILLNRREEFSEYCADVCASNPDALNCSACPKE